MINITVYQLKGGCLLINNYLDTSKYNFEKHNIEFQTIFPVVNNNSSNIIELNKSHSSQKIEPYKLISQVIHSGEYRDEGVPFFWHPLRMSFTLDNIINTEKIKKNSFFYDIYTIMRNGIFMHDVFEHLKNKCINIEPLKKYMQSIKKDTINQHIIEVSSYFTNDKNLPREEYLNQIQYYDKIMQFIIYSDKIFDIYDNSLTIRKYAGEEKTNIRIEKLETDLDFIDEACEKIKNHNLIQIYKDTDIIYKLKNITQDNISKNIKGYKQQLVA